MDRYSASALDRTNMGGFLALQETQLALRNMQYPVVDLLVSGQPAQSASEKP